MKEDTYYARNKETVLARVKEYQAKNRSYRDAYFSQYYQKNKEKIKEQMREYRIAHPKQPKPPKPKKQPAEEMLQPIVVEPELQSNVTYTQHDFIVQFD